MEITLKGDAQIKSVPSLKDKALRINLNENIYGTFAEIGAGQETVRHFFRAGGASGTRTLPINVYQQGFAISDIGMGSAVSIVIVVLLLMFMFFYFKLLGKRVDEN